MVSETGVTDDEGVNQQRTHQLSPDLPLVPFDALPAAALTVLGESGGACAAVTVDGAPYALVTPRELSGMTADVAVGQQVRWVLLDAGATNDEREIVELFNEAAWRWMLLRGRPESEFDPGSRPGAPVN